MDEAKKNASERLGPKSADEVKKDEDTKKDSPFGKDVVIAMYIVYNQALDDWGVIGAPGFLENRSRAYFALMMANKNLDDYYAKKKSLKERFTQGITAFNNKMNFRNFTRFKR